MKLEHYMLEGKAWRSLKPYQRALYIELAMRFNGQNNGEIFFSVRQAAREIHIGKDTAANAFRELAGKGFIKVNQPGSFDWKLGLATTWILTEHPLGDELPTKDFMKWQPENPKAGPNSRTRRPNWRTSDEPSAGFCRSDVPGLGPPNGKCTQ